MEVQFSSETEGRLAEAAAHAGRGTEDYVRDLVERLLSEEAEFRAAVREGFAAIDRGEFLEEDEMDRRVQRLFRS